MHSFALFYLYEIFLFKKLLSILLLKLILIFKVSLKLKILNNLSLDHLNIVVIDCDDLYGVFEIIG